MGCWSRSGLVLSLLALASPLMAQPATRRPQGIYAVVYIEENIKKEQAANPSVTGAELKTYFVSLYQDLLNNPAVSGLALWVNWEALNTNPPAAANPYDWTYLDDAFNQASLWNGRNPTKAPKTIQLVPLPGFQTPHWLLDQIPSCDGLFRTPAETPSRTCGKATFAGFVEGRGVRVLPMPWNPLYKSAWRTFLTALAARYESNPAGRPSQSDSHSPASHRTQSSSARRPCSRSSRCARSPPCRPWCSFRWQRRRCNDPAQ